MIHSTTNLANIWTEHLRDRELPIYTSNHNRVLFACKGKIFENGCVHESERFAEKCCHDSYDWDNADDCLIMMEASP